MTHNLDCNLQQIMNEIPDVILWPYAEHIRFARYPVVRGQMFDVLIINDGDKRIGMAVHTSDTDFDFFTENADSPIIQDFLSRTDWKEYWCLTE